MANSATSLREGMGAIAHENGTTLAASAFVTLPSYSVLVLSQDAVGD